MEEIQKVFQILPKSIKDELHTLIHYQVFISTLANKNKIELFFAKFNRMKLEFTDIAKAPKGAMYNATIMVPKFEESFDWRFKFNSSVNVELVYKILYFNKNIKIKIKKILKMNW